MAETKSSSDKTAEGPDHAIGAALKDLRESQALSARPLAEQSGVSAAMISRIESGQVSPSISTMSSLSEALDVPLASLFRDLVSERSDFTHIKKGSGITSTRLLGEHKHDYVNLSQHKRRDLHFEAHLVTMNAESGQAPKYVGHGVVFIHVMSGSALFQYGKQMLTLEEGDCLSIDAELVYGVNEVLTDTFTFLSVQTEARR